MPDHKFRQHADRNYVLLDAKQRIIDLMENGQELPEVGIYDEPVRYFKANEEWCKIIFGWLDWLEDVAGWHDAEDDNYSGIQQILIFEEGIDPMSMDFEALTQAISDGIYQAVNDVAAQIKSGTKGGFSVGEDGTVTTPSDDPTEDLPEDDPETTWSESKAANYGGSISVGRAINEYIARLDALYGTDSTPDTPLAQAQYTMKFLYIVDATLSDNAIDAYYLYRAVPNGQLGSLGTSNFYNHLYCEGHSFESIVRWILDGLAFTFAKEQIFIGLIEALGDAFYSDAYAQGILIPSLDYVAAPCEPVETEILILDMSTAETPQKTTNAVHKAGHRLLLEISGTFTDSDVPNTIDDFFYHVETLTGIISFVPSLFIFNGAGIPEPTQALMPYEPSHAYALTVDVPTTSSGTIIFGRSNDPYNLPNVSGIITIKITDLGQYA